MTEKNGKLKGRYSLRHAAGMYWLLDLAQPGIPYKRPVCMNDAGALIFDAVSSGRTKEEAAEILSKEYEITKTQAASDVEDFIEQLRKQGVML